jgi:D-beta-D-heptose 7-phosphate kinase/D-beta-D-heptose 1-phosphate adenosyltransferase
MKKENKINNQFNSLLQKIVSIDEYMHLKHTLTNKKIVFTNGCFDIIHSGHVLYLDEAKSLGDILVLGLNSDASIKRLKGENRPVNTLQDRAIVLAGLSCIDYIISFNEDTPIQLIKNIMPDVLVKGGDWQPEQIVGSDVVIKNGGEVKSLQFIEGKSTTGIIEKAKFF